MRLAELGPITTASRRRRGALVAAIAVLPSLFLGTSAQARGPFVSPDAGSSSPTAAVEARSFESVAGLPAIERALASDDVTERASAVGRAAEIGSEAAWKLVRQALRDDHGDDVDAWLTVRLAAARALALRDGALDGDTVKALQDRVASPAQSEVHAPPRDLSYSPYSYPGGYYPGGYPGYGYGGGYGMPAPAPRRLRAHDAALAAMLRETCAVALALHVERAGRTDKDAQSASAALASLVFNGDAETSRAAMGAAMAVSRAAIPLPETKLDGGGDAQKLTFIRWADASGDLRASDRLALLAEDRSGRVKAEALRALARQGDGRAADLARKRLKESSADAATTLALHVAAVEALLRLGASDGEDALLELSKDATTRPEVIALAARFPGPKLIDVLATAAASGDDRAAAALAKIGDAGLDKLAALLDAASDAASDARTQDNVADGLATALALASSEGGLTRLAGKLGAAKGARARSFVRAAAAALAVRGRAHAAFAERAAQWRASPVEAERQAAATYLGVAHLADAIALVSSTDPATRRAAATALAAHPIAASADAARAAIAGSTIDDDATTTLLAAVGARGLDGTPAHDLAVSSDRLSRWLNGDAGHASLAAYILAARCAGSDRALVDRALAAPEVSVRSAAILGLGVCRDDGASGRLSRLSTTVAHAELRRAVMRAMVSRRDPKLAPAIARMAKVDDDVTVRALATVGGSIADAPISPLLEGHEVFALHARQAGAEVARAPLFLVAAVTRSDGLTLPAIADVDGAIFLFGIPAGPSAYELRPAEVATTALAVSSASVAPAASSAKAPSP